MIDIKLIRENPEAIKQRYLAKEVDFSSEIDRILFLDGKRRELIYNTESLKAEQNKVSKQIPAMKKAGEDTAPIMAQMKTLSDKIKAIDAELKTVEEEYNTLMLGLYNLPRSQARRQGE
jgi:seryl-tRNA synthetase